MDLPALEPITGGGTFYAGSVGWRIDKEAFLSNNNFIDRLLLRAGYGSIGNQEIGDYPFTDMINAGYNYPLGKSSLPGMRSQIWVTA